MVESGLEGGVGGGYLSTLAVENTTLWGQSDYGIEKAIDICIYTLLGERHVVLVADVIERRWDARVALIEAELEAGFVAEICVSKLRMCGDMVAGADIGNKGAGAVADGGHLSLIADKHI
jgi:hypothetical protein